MHDAIIVLLCLTFYGMGYSHATIIDARRNMQFMRDWLSARGGEQDA